MEILQTSAPLSFRDNIYFSRAETCLFMPGLSGESFPEFFLLTGSRGTLVIAWNILVLLEEFWILCTSPSDDGCSCSACGSKRNDNLKVLVFVVGTLSWSFIGLTCYWRKTCASQKWWKVHLSVSPFGVSLVCMDSLWELDPYHTGKVFFHIYNGWWLIEKGNLVWTCLPELVAHS